MKKIFFAVLVFLATAANAVNNDTVKVRKHEIGFGFTNLYNLFGGNAAAYGNGYLLNSQDDYGPTSLDFYSGGGYGYGGVGYYGDYYSGFNPGYGVTYKYHLKEKGALRVAIDFSNNKTKSSGKNGYPGATDTLFDYQTHSKKIVIKIGYQFEKQIKRIMVYGGLDAFYYLKKNDYVIDGTYLSSYIISEKGNSSISGLGIAPFGGVSFKINELFSISTEGRFRIGNYTSKSSYSGVDNTLIPFSGNSKGTSFETKFSPIGLISFNIHL